MSDLQRQEDEERHVRVDWTKEALEDLERRYRNVTEANRALVERKQQQLRSLVGQLATTEQRERKHLATELHDYLAQ